MFLNLPAIILEHLEDFECTNTPKVFQEDVPEFLHSNKSLNYEELNEARWDYLMGEAIFAFNSLNSDKQINSEEASRIAYGTNMFGKYFQSFWTE